MIHQFRYGVLPWHDALYAAILGEQRDSPRSALAMARGEAWSGRKRLATHPAAGELLGLFRARLLEVSGSGDWQFSAWANVSLQGGAVGEHDHSPNQWSGIYYLTDGAPILFHSPRLTIPPEPGLMLVFPSSERHSVAVQVAAAPRVSIAINAMLGPAA
jgi:hypothetical protein